MAISYPIYLDNNATTAVDPLVLDAMLPTFRVNYGNPSSHTHSFGWYAQELVTIARERVAATIGAGPHEVIFTSGATESNNTVLRGVVERLSRQGKKLGHILSVATEHHSVLEPIAYAKARGIEVTILPVDSQGRISESDFIAALNERTAIVSLMLANNEIGTLHDVPKLAQIARARGILVHTDATQALGKLPIDVGALGVDFLSLSGHKAYGPKGVGILYVREATSTRALYPLLLGAGQEADFRSGTLNVSGIVGLGVACLRATELLESDRMHLVALSKRFLDGIQRQVPEAILNGPGISDRLPGNINLSFRGFDVNSVIGGCGGRLAVSLAAACSSATGRASHVIEAIYQGSLDAPSAVRIGFGRFNTTAEVDVTVDIISGAVRKLR